MSIFSVFLPETLAIRAGSVRTRKSRQGTDHDLRRRSSRWRQCDINPCALAETGPGKPCRPDNWPEVRDTSQVRVSVAQERIDASHRNPGVLGDA